MTDLNHHPLLRLLAELFAFITFIAGIFSLFIVAFAYLGG